MKTARAIVAAVAAEHGLREEPSHVPGDVSPYRTYKVFNGTGNPKDFLP